MSAINDPQGTIMLTPEQAQVALAKLVAERKRQSGLDRFLRAAAQVLDRIAIACLLASLLFVRDYGGLAVGFVLMGLLLFGAQLAINHMQDVERFVEGQEAAQRLGIRQRIESELAEIRDRTWYWVLLSPLYLWLLVAQWTGWPRPWWLFVLGIAIFAKLVYDAIHTRMAENDYYASVVDLEHSLQVREPTGQACISKDQAQRLYTIERKQTQRQVAQALMQDETIPLAAVEDELWTSIRDAHNARGESPNQA